MAADPRPIWRAYRKQLVATWRKDAQQGLANLQSWLGPLHTADIWKLRAAHSFLSKQAVTADFQKTLERELARRQVNQAPVTEVAKVETCLFELVGSINTFLRLRKDLHHPRKQEILKEASKLLDDCFACKRELHAIKQQSETKELQRQIAWVDLKVLRLKEQMQPLANEVTNYQSELAKLAAVLRK